MNISIVLLGMFFITAIPTLSWWPIEGVVDRAIIGRLLGISYLLGVFSLALYAWYFIVENRRSGRD